MHCSFSPVLPCCWLCDSNDVSLIKTRSICLEMLSSGNLPNLTYDIWVYTGYVFGQASLFSSPASVCPNYSNVHCSELAICKAQHTQINFFCILCLLEACGADHNVEGTQCRTVVTWSFVAVCVCAGWQAVVTGFQEHAGRYHQFSATRTSSPALLGHISHDRWRVCCKIFMYCGWTSLLVYENLLTLYSVVL